MSANLIAATGSWGTVAETSLGIIIESLEEVTRTEKSYLRDAVGQRSGASFYDESIEVKVSGKLTANTPFSTKLGANVTMANAIAANSLYNNNAGRTILNEAKRSASNEDWKGIEADIEVLPFFG